MTQDDLVDTLAAYFRAIRKEVDSANNPVQITLDRVRDMCDSALIEIKGDWI